MGTTEEYALTTSGIRRAGPPQAVQKIRENQYLVKIFITESPCADWRRLFYEAERDAQAEFTPRSVEISGTLLRFKSDPASVEQRIASIDRWIDKATQKEASMGARSEVQRQKREEEEREAQELSEWNSRWAKL